MATILLFWQHGTEQDPLCREAGHNYRKMRKNSRSIVEFGHHLRRFNMKLRKCAKNKSVAVDIVPDTLFVGEFWKGVINLKYIWSSLTLQCVTKAKRVERRAHVRTNRSAVCAYGSATKKGKRTDIFNHLGSVGPCRRVIQGTTPIPGELFCWDFFEMYHKMTASLA